ncbi:MAG: hypothetical protein ACR2H3_11415 [Acidimicrobiales bacterium]
MVRPERSSEDPSSEAPRPGDGWWVLAAAISIVFVASAIVLEVLGGSFANSPVPDWAHLVPIAWPNWLRAAWWVAVAGAAGLFRFGLHRLGLRQRPVVVVASVLPFLVFAGGIAASAEWATWH